MTDSSESRFADRRATPRFDTRGRILGQLETENLPVRIREIGLHGFSIETLEPIAPNLVTRIRFTSYDDWSTVLEARSVHTRPSCTADGLPCFVTGFSFVRDPARDAETIVRYMIEKVTSVAFFGG